MFAEGTCCFADTRQFRWRAARGAVLKMRDRSFSALRAYERPAERFIGTACDPAVSVGACMALLWWWFILDVQWVCTQETCFSSQQIPMRSLTKENGRADCVHTSGLVMQLPSAVSVAHCRRSPRRCMHTRTGRGYTYNVGASDRTPAAPDELPARHRFHPRCFVPASGCGLLSITGTP